MSQSHISPPSCGSVSVDASGSGELPDDTASLFSPRSSPPGEQRSTSGLVPPLNTNHFHAGTDFICLWMNCGNCNCVSLHWSICYRWGFPHRTSNWGAFQLLSRSSLETCMVSSSGCFYRECSLTDVTRVDKAIETPVSWRQYSSTR